MKLFLPFITAALGQQCDTITVTTQFQSIGNAKVDRKCKSTDTSTCKVKCQKGFDLAFYTADQLEATCGCVDDSCTWSYGDHGTGEGNLVPDFACCTGAFKDQKRAQSPKRLKSTAGKPYIEADATSALLVYKLKSGKQNVSNGYSVLMIFDSILPSDLTITTFSRMEVSNTYNDQAASKTYVMFRSKAGFDTLDNRATLFLSFTLTSDDGTTNVADYLENTDADIKLYKDRQDCFCPGNENFCESVQPTEPTKFASFNIQVFGAAKYGKDVVKDQIVTILRRYDVSTIQEIRESAGTSFPALVADMNTQEDIYDFHVGERQGRSTSKEQVGFIWNRNMFSMVDAYDFDDTNDVFERPPGVLVLERIGDNASSFETSKFIVISSHVKPETGVTDTVSEDEINALADVKADAVTRHPDVTNVIIAGDFNADCDYVQDPPGLTLFTDPLSTFLIPFETDTTVGATDCAYDHIVVYGDTLPDNSDAAGVFNYQTFYDTDNILHEGEAITELISDHFPVEFTFL